jgi:hypothetical protein
VEGEHRVKPGVLRSEMWALAIVAIVPIFVVSITHTCTVRNGQFGHARKFSSELIHIILLKIQKSINIS